MSDGKKYDPGHNAALSQHERRELEQAKDAAPTPPPIGGAVPLGQSVIDATFSPSSSGQYPATKAELRKALNINDIKTVVAMVVIAIGTAFTVYKFVLNDARAQTDAGVQLLSSKHDDLRREVERNQKTNDARDASTQHEIQQIKADVNEMRQDLREFYKAWRDDKRSARLDQPLDGGR